MTDTPDRSTDPVLAEDLYDPVPYVRRTRAYYRALGYPVPYRWARFDDVPFAPLVKRLEDTRVALITTAAERRPGAGEQGPGAPYNAAAKFYAVWSGATDSHPDLGISHLGYDRSHTTAADPNTYFPLARLAEAAAEGRIGALTRRFHGAPTTRSARDTIERDAPEILERCREDGADAALLVAN